MAEDLLGEDLHRTHIEKSADSGERWELDSDGFRTYDSGDVERVTIPGDGSSPLVPSPSAGDDSQKAAPTAWVQDELADYLALATIVGLDKHEVQIIPNVTVAQATTTTLVTLTGDYPAGFYVARGYVASNSGNVYLEAGILMVDADAATVTTLARIGWTVFANPTFSMVSTGTGNKAFRVNQPNTSSPGDTVWRGFVWAIRN